MSVFVEIGIIIAIATAVSIAMRALRQPLLIGYIITGLLVGPYVLGVVHSYETIRMLGEIGIALLLFIVGLNLSPRILKELGMVSLLAGLGQLVFTAVVGFFIAQALGFGSLPSLYIAVALTFSSTIIVLKLLSDKGDLETLYGKISIGYLLFQDIAAMVLLIMVATLSRTGPTLLGAGSALAMVARGVFFAVIFLFASTRLLPRLSAFLARSQETLFVFSIGWGLGIASLFYWLGLSLEVGALVAGVTLAASPYHREISARMRPLRDFFLILFFVFLGSQMTVGDVSKFTTAAIVFSLFVLIGNPLIMMIIMGALGFGRRTSFLTSITSAQISEFSLILAALGVKVAHLSNDELSLITLVGIITIAISSYLILYAERIYQWISPALFVFERKRHREDEGKRSAFDTVLFGCNRIGYEFVEMFRHERRRFLIVDYNPEIIVQLKREGIPCRYGDAQDLEFLGELGLERVKMVISTIPDTDTNRLLLRWMREHNPDALVIITAHDVEDAQSLYLGGASYVIMPHFLGGQHAAQMVSENKFSAENFRYERAKHLAYLENKRRLGHQHPPAEWMR